MADRFIQLLCMLCHVCMILYVCSIQGVACDVPDDVVYTDQHINVRIGDSVALKCQFRGTAEAVYWKKRDDKGGASTLVSWLGEDTVTGSCGDRPCSIMEMNENRSLVIKEVSIAEQGQYVCRVVDYKGKWIQNFTEISVFSHPNKPYPFINECLRSPNMNSNQTCEISTAEDPINISCTVLDYFPDLDLFFRRGSQNITDIHFEETPNGDKKKNKSITIQASPSSEPYVCVASDIPGVAGRSEASVFIVKSSTGSTLPVKIVFPLLAIIVLIAGIAVGAYCYRRYIRQQEPVSYVELWKIVDEGALVKVNAIVGELVGNPERNLGKEDLYTRLCEWKEVSSGNVSSLYRAFEKLGFHDDLEPIKDFRASKNVRVSDSELEYICWHVRSCEDETVNPILRVLYSSDREGRRPTFSTSNNFEDNLRKMKRWKLGTVSERATFCNGSQETSIQLDQVDEDTPMDPDSAEAHLKVITSPPNQVIRLCLALEEAGKKVNERHRPMYLKLAKTFFKTLSTGPVSYLELWTLVDEIDLATVNDIVSKLEGNPELNLGKEDLYTRLCEWKEESSVIVLSLYRAMEELGFEHDLRTIKDFRTWTNFQVSNDELQHICWHVRSCEEETVNPILRALYYPNRVGTRPISPTSNSFEDDLQLMQTWKEDTVSETFCSGSKDVSMQETMDDEVTRMDPDSAEVHLIVTASSPNQMIQLCLALEEAGKAVAELHRPVYLQLAKTFFKRSVSYAELWKLVDESDLAKVNDIVSKLVGNPEQNLRKEDLYTRLCEWKEESSGNIRSLNRTINKLGLCDDLRAATKDFRASKTFRVSDDDLVHICRHVRCCEDETVNPILRGMYSPDREASRPIVFTCHSFEDELKMMKNWKDGKEEGQLEVITSPPNQLIRLCLALEEAGKIVAERHRPVYLQLAKTFFKRPVSYVELWKLVDERDLARVNGIVTKLVGNPEQNLRKEDLYRILCEWKEESFGNISSLYSTMRKLKFQGDLEAIQGFRACDTFLVSGDDLAHICRHVRSCEDESVNPILRGLYSTNGEASRSIFSTCNSFEDELQMMKNWKDGKEEGQLKIITSPRNQMIRLCLALEEAGKTVAERHRPVYLQLAKTFFKQPVSYVELWKLVEESDLAKVNDIVSKLVGNPERNLGKEDLYRRLCEWKEETFGNANKLYRAIKKLRFQVDLIAIQAFRASTTFRVSDDVLAHICQHVRSCEGETVNPILRALYSPDREGTHPLVSASNSFEDDLRLMKKWTSDSVSEKVTFCSGSKDISMQETKDDEMTTMNSGSGEVHLKLNTSSPNQMILLCLALEEAGKTVAESHSATYLHLAKTFFKTSEPPDNVIAARNEVEPCD